jgi:hypothetical protein
MRNLLVQAAAAGAFPPQSAQNMTSVRVGSVSIGGTVPTQWYREHTGGELTGSIAEQNEQWENYKRNFRAQAEPDQWDPAEFAEYARDCGL